MRGLNHIKRGGVFVWSNRAANIAALFMLVASTFIPAASAYAAEHAIPTQPQAANSHIKPAPTHANKPMATNYAGPIQQAQSATVAAADAKPTGKLAQLTKDSVGPQQPVYGKAAQPKITPHELTDKRTATTSLSQNADGSLTKTQYFSPKFYKKDSAWATIDTKLVEDKNAGDASNIATKAFGVMESWASPTTTYTVQDNDWRARFAPSDFADGMLRIKKGEQQVGFSPVNANKVAPTISTNKDGQQVVRYANLWPGIDVTYVVYSDQVKENVILNDKNAANEVSFKVVGATLQKQATDDKSAPVYMIKGALGDSFGITPANLILNNFGFVSDISVFQ